MWTPNLFIRLAKTTGRFFLQRQQSFKREKAKIFTSSKCVLGNMYIGQLHTGHILVVANSWKANYTGSSSHECCGMLQPCVNQANLSALHIPRNVTAPQDASSSFLTLIFPDSQSQVWATLFKPCAMLFRCFYD